MEYRHASSATTFSKKLANGGSLRGKHVYDGVFGNATKAGSKTEDYREIFGGSSNCSIPILDLPELKESKASVEARNSRPDYSKIFGGFGDSDFAVAYEELFAKPKKVKNSSQEAGAAAEARFCPTGQKHSNFSEEKQAPSPQVSLSYDKSNPGSKNGTSGVTRVAQLHAIPGYTCLIDEITPPLMTEGDRAVRPVLSDAHLNVNVGEGIKQSKPLRKVVSGPQPRGAAIDTSRSTDFQTKSSRNRSFSNDISFDAFDIGLGTQPPPMSPLSSLPNFGNNTDGSKRSMNSEFGVFGSDASEGAAGSYSPPFFDEQIDANSAAAASAAAVRKAIEEAQAKLKIAKQLMERKKEGVQKRVRPSFNGLRPQKREVKALENASRSKEEVQQMPPVVYNPKNVFTSLQEHNEMKASQFTPDFGNAKKSSPAKNVTRETHYRESRCNRAGHGLEAESEKATKGFSEPAGNTDYKAMVLEVKQANNVKKMKPSTNENECKEKMTGEENIKKPMECEKQEAFEEAPLQERIEIGLNSVKATFELDMHGNNTKSAEELHQVENKEKIRIACEDEEADQTLKAPYEQEECESMQKKLHEPEENAKCEIQESEEIKTMKEPEEVHNRVEIEAKQRVAHNQEEMENQLNGVPVREENDWKLDEINKPKGNGKGQQKVSEWAECEKKKHEGGGLEENEKKPNIVSKPKNFEHSCHKQEANEVRFDDFLDKEGSEKRFGEDCRGKDYKNLEEAKQEEKIVNQDCQTNEINKGRICEWIKTERIQTGINLGAEDEIHAKATQQAFRYQENNLETINDVFKQNENEIVGKADEAVGDTEKFEGAEVTAEVIAVEENGRTMEVTEHPFPRETEEGLKEVEEASTGVEEENFENGIPDQGLTGLDAIKKNMADLYSGETDLNHKKNEYDETEYERICEQEKYFEECTAELDENYEDVSELDIGPSDDENETNCAYSHEVRWLDNGIESKTLHDSEKYVEEAACVLGEKNKDGKESEIAINHEEDETYFESSSDEKWVNNRNDEQAAQQPHVFYGEGKSIGISQERTNQRTDKEENNQETITVEKREAEDTLQKEVELEKKHHERKEESKARELEKEKERIAVERAIREARERAFADARERAERATAERATAGAQPRVMAKARERSSAEANSKSAGEKASIEAKLKAERAAVERATAEARERALEKALSEKAAFKAKNQTEKLATEKFSGASRDAGIKSSDQQYKGPGPSSSSTYPSSSTHDVPYSTERLVGANGESVERCKATLERNQRTAERVAKALAEKNLRDLLTQKEQAERNRLAETLDADVKRWSSGKERNLRFLLSTLQYILGPDSGWQPIPLTDIISSAAVKKAYRKATLFVHPDKLQQRGASIRQKYTCEKVFDLLKDAWNKFSAAEER